MSQAFDAIAATVQGTRSEPDGDDLLWGLVNACHRAAERLGRLLDDNEVAQRDSQREQDGTEVKSVELERLLGKGQVLIDRRDALETFRDAAAIAYRRITGDAWTPRHGSKVNHRALTAAMIDSRDFIAAKRGAKTEVLLPKGAKIAFIGGTDCNDHRAIWAALDRVQTKHVDMVLLHGGSPKGAELIAAKWADGPQGRADRVQARLGSSQARRPVQAQRRLAGDPADRCRRIPRQRGQRQPRRQGPEARHPAVRLPSQDGCRMSSAPFQPTCRVSRSCSPWMYSNKASSSSVRRQVAGSS